MKVIDKIKTIIAIVSAGDLWARRKEATLAILEILGFFASNFIDNADTAPPLQSVQPMNDDDAVKALSLIVADAEKQTEGGQALTMPPFLVNALRGWLLRLLTRLMMSPVAKDG